MLQFLGNHAGEQSAPLAAAYDDLVRQHVELVLRFTLHVLAAVLAEIPTEGSLGGHRRDRLDGGSHIHKQRSLSANRRLAWRSRARSSALRTLRALAKFGWRMRAVRYSSNVARAPGANR